LELHPLQALLSFWNVSGKCQVQMTIVNEQVGHLCNVLMKALPVVALGWREC